MNDKRRTTESGRLFLERAEPEWRGEYKRLGAIYAFWGGLFAMTAPVFSILAESKVVPDDHGLWLTIRWVPFFTIGIGLVLFRMKMFSHEVMFELIAISLFICFAYRVNCRDWDTNLITGLTVLVPSAFMSLVRPRLLLVNGTVWFIANLLFYHHFCGQGYGAYFNEKGNVTLIITAIVTFSVAAFRYQNIRNNFINRLVLKEALDEVEHQRKQSDELLLNILPEEVASELKSAGKVTPRYYEQVSVLFTDFKGFTFISESRTPEAMVDILQECFTAFDAIIDRHGLEKIKTMGDGYLCAGGLPVPNTTNPVDAVRAALEMMAYMRDFQARQTDGLKLELRIGIHTGPLVAGVIGNRKFAYDIWGDTVNTASRMESSGVEGEVNISGSTYALIQDRFICESRGEVKAKNKGEITMYFVRAER